MERDLVRFIAILLCVLVAGPSLGYGGFLMKQDQHVVDMKFCVWKNRSPISTDTIEFYHNGTVAERQLPIASKNINPKKPEKFEYFTKETKTRWLYIDPGTIEVASGYQDFYGPVIFELIHEVTVDMVDGKPRETLYCVMHHFN